MAISINWGTRVVFVPRADNPIIQASPEIRSFDLDTFRLALKSLEDSDLGMPHPDTHIHYTTFDISGVTYARALIMVNGYTIEFEDGQYGVSGSGANSNILDVKVANSVSYLGNNAAGLIESGTSGLTPAESTTLSNIETIVNLVKSAVDFIVKLLRNKRITNPITGKQTIYDDDSATPLVEGNLYEDVDGTTPYEGQGADRADRMI